MILTEKEKIVILLLFDSFSNVDSEKGDQGQLGRLFSFGSLLSDTAGGS